MEKSTSTSLGSLLGMGAGAAFGGPMGAMIGSSAGGLLGGMFGGDGEAMEILKRAQAAIAAIPEPTIEDMKLVLEPLVQQGILTPEAYTTFLQEPSAFTQINLDQAPRNAEIAALSQIQDIAESGGRDAQFRSTMNDALNRSNMQLQGQTGAILQNAAQRGALNSNMTQAAALANAYAGNANMANASVNAAAEAEKRALDAIGQSAMLGGQIRSQDYNEAAQKAQAIDAINRYNAQNSQSQANLNTQGRNLAQAQNLDLASQVAQYNTGTRNQAATHNSGLAQQQFQNRLAKAAAMAGVSTNQANLASQNASNQAATQGNLIGGLGQGLSSYYNNQNLLNAINGMNKNASSTGGWTGMVAKGGVVPGEAQYPGDHPGNDTVPAKLSPGEVVVPRSAAGDPVSLAKFVASLPKRGSAPKIDPEDVRTVLHALTGMREMWKGGYC